MNSCFNTVLIPVDFTVSTDVALQKALSLCTEQGGSIHLLHVPQKPAVRLSGFYRLLFGTSKQEQIYAERQAREKIEQLAMLVRDCRKETTVLGWIANGTIETVISEKAKEIGADLIVIGKNSHHSLLPFLNTVVSSRIAKKTGIAVLTAKPGSINFPIKTVVIPVSEEFSDKKMAMINALRKKAWIQIRLVSFVRESNMQHVLPQALLHAYRRLKNNLINEVTCKVLHGPNKALAILRYCEEVDADLLIVSPGSETRIGWLNKHISDVLPVRSKTQVLAIRPA